MNKSTLIVASVLGMLSVILGAYGAHGLEKIVDAEAVEIFNTGVQYQMYHALFLLFIGVSGLNNKVKQVILYTTLIGIIFFSGSIYGLSTNTLTAFDFKSIGFITPIGGLLLIISWLILLINIVKTKLD